MKLQLLYIFVFAAPLLARLLSPGPATPPAAEAVEAAPAKVDRAAPAATKEPAPAAAPATEAKEAPKRSSVLRISPAHTRACL